jgi:thiol-disulfide isomerase/thioredoxin
MNNLSQMIASGSNDAQPIVLPNDFGKTLETLLDHQITWKAAPTHRNVLARGWSLADFWELTSWPRDTAGRGETRYGLPVQELEDTIQERMISEPPGIKSRFSEYKETYSEEEEAEMEKEVAAYALDQNVLTIRGVDGLQRDIIAAEKDCLLFLSAPWCRTCRYLSPQYTRMARENSSDITFAKADATGTIGKALGIALQVDAVPTFVLFRRGHVYGSPLSISRLPSKKLEQAVDYLAAGKGWDDALFAEDS